MNKLWCTKRIQPARGWCATVGGTVRGNTANCIHLPRLSGGPAAQFFWGSRPCVPAAWLAERLLLAGDIESNPGPRPTLKTPTHTQPPTLLLLSTHSHGPCWWGSPMFPLVVHQPASPSIWPAVQSLRRGLSTNPGATMWCVCGCS